MIPDPQILTLTATLVPYTALVGFSDRDGPFPVRELRVRRGQGVFRTRPRAARTDGPGDRGNCKHRGSGAGRYRNRCPGFRARSVAIGAGRSEIGRAHV